MWQEDRHQRIRGLLSTFKRVTTDRIADELGVSRETVRRDLIELETLGELRRVHGGAVKVHDEPPLDKRSHLRVQAKRALARAAVREVESGQMLFIDAGSTTAILADELARLSGLTVITNSFDVALRMNGGARANRVVVLGGEPGADLPATFGEITVAEIQRYRADLALLSPVGIDAVHGATSFDQGEAEVARAMVAGARRVVILADHGKIGIASRVSYCPVSRIDRLVTDAKAAASPAFGELRACVVDIVLAE